MSHFGSIPSMMVTGSGLCTDYKFEPADQRIEVFEEIERFLMIINVTDGIVIYNPANPGTTGARLNGRYLQFQYDTTSMGEFDDLLVFCKFPENKSKLLKIEESLETLVNEFKTYNERFEEAFKTEI